MLLIIIYSKLFNSTGLAFDIVGAILVFFNTPPKTYKTYLYNDNEELALEAKAKRINNRAKAGLISLMIGFLLQLISNFL